MQGVDPEAEEVWIAEAVGLSLEGLDLAVRALQRSGADRHVIVSLNAGSVEAQGVGHLLKLPKSGGAGSLDPAVEEAGGALPVGLTPEVTEILLQVK